MPIFAHEENPLSDQEWENIKNVVINVARRRMIGRRIVDLHGPLWPQRRAVQRARAAHLA